MNPSASKKKWIRRFAGMFLLVLFVLCPQALAENGLVASMQGKAWLSPAKGEGRYLLKMGQSVPPGAFISTGPRSVLRILNPDGSMRVINENCNHIYTLSKEQSSGLTNLSRFLKNVSQSGYQIHGTAVRNLAGESFSRRYLEVHGASGIERILQQMVRYARDRQWNRLNTGLAILKNSFSESAIFKQLDFTIPDTAEIESVWQFWRISTSGKRLELDVSKPLKAGAPFQITYFSNGAGFFYLLVTDRSNGSYHATRLIYPPIVPETDNQPYPLPESVSEHMTMTLPGTQTAYFHNRDSEADLFWAFSCLAPLSKKTLLSLQQNPFNSPSSDNLNIRSNIESIKPSVCPLSMIREIPIVNN